MSSIEVNESIFQHGLLRPCFNNGSLLTAEVLQNEQLSHQIVQQCLGQAIGEGVINGLHVKMGERPDGQPSLIVSPGKAFNRKGQVLSLPEKVGEIELNIVSADGTVVLMDNGMFGACQDERHASAPTPSLEPVLEALDDDAEEGFPPILLYLLTASHTESPGDGRNTVGKSTSACYRIEGIQFRLIAFDLLGENLGFIGKMHTTWASGLIENLQHDRVGPMDYSLLRNQIAHYCLGSYALLDNPTFFFAAEVSSKYGLLDELRDDGLLTHAEVPLGVALMYDNALQFVDMWSVRRRVHKIEQPVVEPLPVTDRRLAENEAAYLQFQDHLNDIAPFFEDSDRHAVGKWFEFLPAAGFVPLPSLDVDDYVAEDSVMPLDLYADNRPFNSNLMHERVFVGADELPDLLQRSFYFPPVRLAHRASTRAFRLYEIWESWAPYYDPKPAGASLYPIKQNYGPQLFFSTVSLPFAYDRKSVTAYANAIRRKARQVLNSEARATLAVGHLDQARLDFFEHMQEAAQQFIAAFPAQDDFWKEHLEEWVNGHFFARSPSIRPVTTITAFAGEEFFDAALRQAEPFFEEAGLVDLSRFAHPSTELIQAREAVDFELPQEINLSDAPLFAEAMQAAHDAIRRMERADREKLAAASIGNILNQQAHQAKAAAYKAAEGFSLKSRAQKAAEEVWTSAHRALVIATDLDDRFSDQVVNNKALSDQVEPVLIDAFPSGIGGHNVVGVAFTPQMRLVAGDGNLGGISFFDQKSLVFEETVGGGVSKGMRVRDIDVAPTGSLAAVDSDVLAYFQSAAPSDHFVQIRTATRSNSAVALSPDGRLLAVGGIEDRDPNLGFVTIRSTWQVQRQINDSLEGEIIKEFAVRVLKELQEGGVLCLAFSPDGGSIATGHGNGIVMIRGLETHDQLPINNAVDSGIHALAFSPADSILAYGVGKELVFYDWHKGIERKRVAAPHEIKSLFFSRSGDRLVSGGQAPPDADGTVVIWDGFLYQELGRFEVEGRDSSVNSIAISFDGSQVAYSSDASVGFADIRSFATRSIKQNLQELLAEVAHIQVRIKDDDDRYNPALYSDLTALVHKVKQQEEVASGLKHTLRKGHVDNALFNWQSLPFIERDTRVLTDAVQEFVEALQQLEEIMRVIKPAEIETF